MSILAVQAKHTGYVTGHFLTLDRSKTFASLPEQGGLIEEFLFLAALPKCLLCLWIPSNVHNKSPQRLLSLIALVGKSLDQMGVDMSVYKFPDALPHWPCDVKLEWGLPWQQPCKTSPEASHAAASERKGDIQVADISRIAEWDLLLPRLSRTRELQSPVSRVQQESFGCVSEILATQAKSNLSVSCRTP